VSLENDRNHARINVSTKPSVSLIMVLKNAMPHLPAAIASVRAQTCSDWELVIQDAVSTDGSLDVLRDALRDMPSASLRSEPDAGVGDAVNRALARCRANIVGFIDGDNLLEPGAVQRVVDHFTSEPDCAAAYAPTRVIDEEGTELSRFAAGPFDVLKLLCFELVPPFATAFFRRDLCSSALRTDDTLRTCADFDIWLRLSHLRIAELAVPLAATRICRISRSRESALYERFCADKTTALERYFASQPDSPLLRSVRRAARAGLYLWAAESVLEIEGPTACFVQWCDRAAEVDPSSRRLRALRRKAMNHKPLEVPVTAIGAA
jgi:glycosyltransferase involved in cell wall biosynthesis